MDAHGETHHSPDSETYNPWSIVNLVFHHLVAEGSRQASEQTKLDLAAIRAAFEEGYSVSG
jgi:hypothetical protein